MSGGGRRWLLLALALLGPALACARKTEHVGQVITSLGGGDGGDARGPGGDGPGGNGAAGGDGGGGQGGAPPATCDPSSALIPAPSSPGWNCPGNCRREPDFQVDPGLFTSAPRDPDPGHQPRLVYPLPGSVHPANLPRISLHWKRSPGAGQSAFVIQIQPAGGLPPYVLQVGARPPVGPTPAALADLVYDLPESVWRTIARENAGSEVTITISAYDTLLGNVATSEPVRLRFSPGPVEGGLHFVSTEKQAGINRYLFGATGAHLLVPRSPTAGPADCVGCHSPSRDGTKLAFAATYAGNLALVRTSDPPSSIITPQAPPGEQAGISPAVSPDGRHVLARDGVTDSLTIYDAETGEPQSNRLRAQLGGRIDYPEWSPDGRSIVATRAVRTDQPPRKYSAVDGELVVIPFGASNDLGEPEVIVREPGQIHAHPSWSPDGQWIVFVSSAAGGETHLDPGTRLRLVRRNGGGPIITLSNATGADGNFSTYPRFVPFGQSGCRLLFITFQSRLTYGLMSRPPADPAWPQLWMSAIDLSEPLGSDPSRPPVWLPFQDLQDKNLLPAWSARVPCSTNAVCGAGASCEVGAGQCVVTPM